MTFEMPPVRSHEPHNQIEASEIRWNGSRPAFGPWVFTLADEALVRRKECTRQQDINERMFTRKKIERLKAPSIRFRVEQCDEIVVGAQLINPICQDTRLDRHKFQNLLDVN